MKTKKEFAEKYAKNVAGISKAEKVDISVATDMLIYLVKSLSDQGPDFYAGCGEINLDEAVKDYRALEGSWNEGRE